MRAAEPESPTQLVGVHRNQPRWLRAEGLCKLHDNDDRSFILLKTLKKNGEHIYNKFVKVIFIKLYLVILVK